MKTLIDGCLGDIDDGHGVVAQVWYANLFLGFRPPPGGSLEINTASERLYLLHFTPLPFYLTTRITDIT